MGKQIIDLVKQLKEHEKTLLSAIFANQKSLNETRDKLATLYWTMDELGLERVEDTPLEELEAGVGTVGKEKCMFSEHDCSHNHAGCANFVSPIPIPVVPKSLDKLENARKFMGVGSICDLIEKYLNNSQDVLFVLPTMKEVRALKSAIYKEFDKDMSDFDVCHDGAHLLSFSTPEDEYHVFFETQKTYKPDFYQNTVYDVLVCENAGSKPGKKAAEKFYAVSVFTIWDYIKSQKGDE